MEKFVCFKCINDSYMQELISTQGKKLNKVPTHFSEHCETEKCVGAKVLKNRPY